MNTKQWEPLSNVKLSNEPDFFISNLLALDRSGYLRVASPDLVFLGARPGIGKTLLAAQIGSEVSKEAPVLMFSLEMTKEQIRSRLRHRNDLQDFHINDTAGLNIDRLTTIAREFDVELGCSIIIVDYVQIVAAAAQNTMEQVRFVVEKLKKLARELGKPILVIAQLNRNSEQRENPEPFMSDFADSAAIEKWADCALIMKRNKETDLIAIHCVKNRHGPRKNFLLKFNQENKTFEDAGDFNG